MPDIPPEAVADAAEAIERELMSGRFCAGHVDSDEVLALAALEAAAPHIRAQVYAEIRQLAITDVERSVKAGFDATALIRFVADLIGGGETGA